MKILLIDNTRDPDCWGSGDIARFLTRDPAVTVVTRRGPHDDLPPDPSAFDRLVLSGSRTSCLESFPWTEHLDAFVRAFLALGRPYLGVCYGHQVLCRVLEGSASKLRRGETPEFGWTRIRQLRENDLLRGLPNEFHSYASHYEEAFALPPGAVRLAESDRCSIQAIQLEGKPVFGIQFHPERLEDEGNRSLAKSREKEPKEAVLGFGRSKALFDAKVGETLFSNFTALKYGI